MLIGHLADVHLGAKLYGRPELRYDTLKAFQSSLEILVNERVKTVVISGDLFDKPRPDNEFLLNTIRLLKSVTEKGIKVILVGGDHDTPKSRDKSPLELLSEAVSNVYYVTLRENSTLDDLILTFENISYAIVPFPRGSRELKKRFYETLIPALGTIVKKYSSRRSVLVGHFGVDEACRWDPVYPASRLPREFAYIALGHVHKRVISKGCDDCPTYAYPGSLYPLKLDEVEDSDIRGPLLVDLSADEPLIQEPKVEVRKHFIARIRVIDDYHLRERLFAKIKAYPVNTGSVIHLDLEVPSRTNLISSIRSLIAEIEKNFGIIVIYRIRSLRGEEDISVSESSGMVDEIELVSKFTEGNRYLSKLVIELKRALVAGEDMSVIRNLVEEIVNEKNMVIWKKIIKRRQVL